MRKLPAVKFPLNTVYKMTEQQLKNEIFSRYGAVTRARGCFLYTKKGIRLTDMYQANGRAILGWGGSDAFTRLKNVMNRGLTGSFITEYSSQIDKAVSDLLGNKRHVVWASEIPDYGVVWEPWNAPEGLTTAKVLVIRPPLPWTDNLFMICLKEGFSEEDFMDSYGEPLVEVPSPVIAGITRAVYDLIAALKEREEKDWFIYDQILCQYFDRNGPYLYPIIPEEEYDDFVLSCLDLGIIINPDYNSHSIVPFGADKGVFSKLKNKEL